jgi:hypothetical protein
VADRSTQNGLKHLFVVHQLTKANPTTFKKNSTAAVLAATNTEEFWSLASQTQSTVD